MSAAGFTKRGDDGAPAFYLVTPDRCIRWCGPGEQSGTIPTPVPGNVPLIAADTLSAPWVLLADGSTHNYNADISCWSRGDNLGVNMKGTLIKAWPERVAGVRRIVALTSERDLLALEVGSPPRRIGPGPVPGDAVAASSDGGSVLVLLADGRLLRSTASGWVVLQQIGAGADVMVRLRAMTGFRLSKGNAPGAIVQKGDEFEVSPARAIELTAMGLAEGVLA